MERVNSIQSGGKYQIPVVFLSNEHNKNSLSLNVQIACYIKCLNNYPFNIFIHYPLNGKTRHSRIAKPSLKVTHSQSVVNSGQKTKPFLLKS